MDMTPLLLLSRLLRYSAVWWMETEQFMHINSWELQWSGYALQGCAGAAQSTCTAHWCTAGNNMQRDECRLPQVYRKAQGPSLWRNCSLAGYQPHLPITQKFLHQLCIHIESLMVDKAGVPLLPGWSVLATTGWSCQAATV
jgi:hypothetical protein